MCHSALKFSRTGFKQRVERLALSFIDARVFMLETRASAMSLPLP
jgi:hypothetical protein